MSSKYYLRMIVILLAATISSLALKQLSMDKVNILMIFIVGVLLVTALTRGYRFGIIASCISVMIFNYFFTEPVQTFAINNTNNITLMLFFFYNISNIFKLDSKIPEATDDFAEKRANSEIVV